MTKQSEASSSESRSSLKTGAERFLARVVTHAVERGYRTPDDFLRRFKPLDLMQALEAVPELRRELLVKAAGVHEKIALKKSTQSAAEDLRIALDEGLTTAAEIFNLIPSDDRVRFLDRAKLFAFAVDDGFYLGQRNGGDQESGVERMLFLLDAAMSEGLLTTADLAEGLSFETIALRLPLKELQRVVEHALTLGRSKQPLTEQGLFEIVPLRSLIGYVPLEHTWNKVIVPKIARPADFVDASGKVLPGPPPAEAPPKEAPRSQKPPKEGSKEPPPKPSHAAASSVTAASTAAPTNGKKPMQEELRNSDADLRSAEEDVDQLLDASENRAAPEEDARSRVTERLAAINRLPPRHAELTTPILLSIESMYAELLESSTDAAREEAIRDSFPNEQQLSTALLALIELLDPSIDVADPVIREADIDSLIKVVLFEERHRYEQAHPSQRAPVSAPSSAQLPAPSRRTLPPPLPRAATPGPPPLPNAEKPR